MSSTPIKLGLSALAIALCTSVAASAGELEPIRLAFPPGPYGETLTLDDRGLTMTFPEEAAKLRIGGRLQIDYGAASNTPRSLGEPLLDNIGVRRAWIESYLSLNKTTELAFQYDFNEPVRPINDALVVFRNFPNMLIGIGNQKEPLSLDQLISDNNTQFVERSLADALVPARNFGAAIGYYGRNWTAVTGVFGGNANTGIDSEGYASTTRVTYAPVMTPDETVHLGIAGSYRSVPTGVPVSLSSRSEAFLFARRYVNTGNIRDAESIGRIGVEAAYRNGPLIVQAEYIRAEISRVNGAPSAGFQGGYIQASYVLNGVNRAYEITPNYNATNAAVFGRVPIRDDQKISNGGFGVFELNARFSAIDLEEGGVRGGREYDETVGLIWYPDRNVRIISDYVHSYTNPSAAGIGRFPVEANTFIGRVQLYW